MREMIQTDEQLKGEISFYRTYLALDGTELDSLHYLRDGMLNEVYGDNVIDVMHNALIFENDGYVEFMEAMTFNKPLEAELSVRLGLSFHRRLLQLEGVKMEQVAGIGFGTIGIVNMEGGR